MTEKLLGQARPGDTSVATLYTAGAGVSTVLKSLRICNTTAVEATCRVFLVPPAGTADETTALYFDFAIPGNSTLSDDGFHVLAATGTIQVRSSTASALTFTACGAEL